MQRGNILYTLTSSVNVQAGKLTYIFWQKSVNYQQPENVSFATTTNKRLRNTSDITAKELSNRQIQKYCELEQLQEGEITKCGKLGSGGQGTVCAGTLKTNDKTTNIIIKEGYADDIEYETQVSFDLLNKAKDNLANDGNLISSQEGFANVVFQQKINNQHIQKRINGVDGRNAIGNIYGSQSTRIDLYNTETGQPNNVKQSLMLAQQLLNGVHAIHKQGMIHGDLKPENIMIETTDNNELTLKIIDLGLAAKQGEDHIGYSNNAAPEVKNNKQCKARTTADIYSTGTILCELLFGKYYDHFHDLFCYRRVAKSIRKLYGEPVEEIVSTNIITKSAISINEIPKWLQRILQQANKKSDGKQLYPPAIYQAIENLIVRMCAFDPNDRPSTQYCLAVLNDLALCDHDAICNDTTGKIKPMVVGTTLQAIQLISDLNELNKKAELTTEEQETQEVLVYNLGRDFVIKNNTIRTNIYDAIDTVKRGKTLDKNQIKNLECINAHMLILSELKNKLTNISTQRNIRT